MDADTEPSMMPAFALERCLTEELTAHFGMRCRQAGQAGSRAWQIDKRRFEILHGWTCDQSSAP